MAKAGTLAELHPELGAETEVAAETEAAADIAAGELVAGKAAAATRRQQAAGAVLSQQPCAHWEGLCLVVSNDL